MNHLICGRWNEVMLESNLSAIALVNILIFALIVIMVTILCYIRVKE